MTEENPDFKRSKVGAKKIPMEFRFHGFKNLWSNKDKPLMSTYFTFQLLSCNFIKKEDRSWMFHFVILNFSFIWVKEPIKLNIPLEGN